MPSIFRSSIPGSESRTGDRSVGFRILLHLHLLNLPYRNGNVLAVFLFYEDVAFIVPLQNPLHFAVVGVYDYMVSADLALLREDNRDQSDKDESKA